jgi:hypothetical protein
MGNFSSRKAAKDAKAPKFEIRISKCEIFLCGLGDLGATPGLAGLFLSPT